MILTIDIENTHIIIGCFDKEKLVFIERIATNLAATSLEYFVTLKTVLDLHSITPNSLDGGIVSSVVPSVTSAVKPASESLIGKKMLVLGPGVRTGLAIAIDDPAQLGSNLVAGAVAAVDHYPAPLIIVDMGTATTFSIIDKNKRFIGGLIIPGVKTSLDALVSRTSLLSNTSLMAPKKVIATNTADCLKSGSVYGAASEIDGVIERIEDEIRSHCTCIATGDEAGVIIPQCRRNITIDDDLLLTGLMKIYYKNI